MSPLAFKKEYIDPICAGTKGSTFRAKRPAFKVGDVVPATCRWGEPPFAWLLVTSIRPIMLAAITNRMARLDGFDNADECRATLREIYGQELDRVWRVRWEKAEPPASGRTPST